MKTCIAVIGLFVSFGLFGQQQNCQQFKNGKFKIIGDQGQEYIIVRKGNRQTEYDTREKTKVELVVTWIDSCTYTLQLKQDVSKPSQSTFPPEMVLTVVILETKENSYIQRTSSNLFETTLEGEVYRIK
ncbi:MAG: hypothetical protein ACTHJT_11935 [Cytophaga sp.]|uniref:hypothetical protein n=1 Tax=Cytophaga sp. TaxID=29535 RepID=UPI003F80E09B